jgi:hypothetical protein
MQVKLKQLIVPPGQQLVITDVSWLMLRTIARRIWGKTGFAD